MRPSGPPGKAHIVVHRLTLSKSYHAGVSSDRTNLSPFTKDYRGLALQCDLAVFRALRGAIVFIKDDVCSMRETCAYFFPN